MEVTKENLKSIKIEHIVEWCRENKQIPWLKEVGARMVDMPIYPTITYYDKEGKERTKFDKKQAPIGTEKVQIPFVNLKYEWVKTFFPELAATKEKKPKKPTMWEMIAALEE